LYIGFIEFILTFYKNIYIYIYSKYDEDSPPRLSLKNKREETYSNQPQINGFHTAKTELAS